MPALYTVGGFTFDLDKSPSQLVNVATGIDQDSEDVLATFGARTFLDANVDGLPDAGNPRMSAQSPGVLLQLQVPGTGQSASSFAVELGPADDGNNTIRRVVEYSGSLLVNGAGDEFALFESAASTVIEPLVVSVRYSNNTWSRYRYEFPDAHDSSQTSGMILFDLSDFGVARGSFVTGFRVTALRKPDTVDNPQGFGDVLFGGGSGFTPVPGGVDNTRSRFDQFGGTPYDADLSYLAVLQSARTTRPSNISPVLTVPDSVTTFAGLSRGIRGIGVLDEDGDNLTVRLSVGHGKLKVSPTTGVTVSGNRTRVLTLSGSAAAINAVLVGLRYRSQVDFRGVESLSLTVGDEGLRIQGNVLINVLALRAGVFGMGRTEQT